MIIALAMVSLVVAAADVSESEPDYLVQFRLLRTMGDLDWAYDVLLGGIKDSVFPDSFAAANRLAKTLAERVSNTGIVGGTLDDLLLNLIELEALVGAMSRQQGRNVRIYDWVSRYERPLAMGETPPDPMTGRFLVPWFAPFVARSSRSWSFSFTPSGSDRSLNFVFPMEITMRAVRSGLAVWSCDADRMIVALSFHESGVGGNVYDRKKFSILRWDEYVAGAGALE